MTATAAHTAQFLDVATGDIQIHPNNPRHKVDTDLADSIREQGVLEPLLVAPWPDDLKGTAAQKRKHLLIAGHRRLAGAKAAKAATVPVILRTDLDTQLKQRLAMLVENLHRSDLTPVEEAEAYQEALEFPGVTQKQLAQDIGQPVTRIRERLKLTKLDPSVRDKVHNGQLTITDALAIGEFQDDAKTSKQLLDRVGTREFDYELQRARNLRAATVNRDRRLDQLRRAGLTVVDSPPKGGKRLENYDSLDLMPFELKFSADKERVDQWVIHNHKDCAGAVAVATTDYGQPTVQHWCATPDAHPSSKPTRPETTQEDLDAQKAEEERAAQVEADVATSTPVRRRHLAQALATVDDATARRRLVDGILDIGEDIDYADLIWVTDEFDPLFDVLEVTRPSFDVEDEQSDQIRALLNALRPALGKLTLPALAVVLDVKRHHEAEQELTSTSRYYARPSDSVHDWLLVLWEEYGYEASDFEASRAAKDPESEQDVQEPSDEPGSDAMVVDEHGGDVEIPAPAPDLEDLEPVSF